MNTPEIAESWSKIFAELLGHHTLADAAHDSSHIRRVVTNARRLALAEGADMRIVVPAAWLHEPDDSVFTLDHLFAKLLKLEGTMQTPAGKAEASRRTQFLRQFLAQLHDEIGAPDPGSEDLAEAAPDGA